MNNGNKLGNIFKLSSINSDSRFSHFKPQEKISH